MLRPRLVRQKWRDGALKPMDRSESEVTRFEKTGRIFCGASRAGAGVSLLPRAGRGTRRSCLPAQALVIDAQNGEITVTADNAGSWGAGDILDDGACRSARRVRGARSFTQTAEHVVLTQKRVVVCCRSVCVQRAASPGGKAISGAVGQSISAERAACEFLQAHPGELTLARTRGPRCCDSEARYRRRCCCQTGNGGLPACRIGLTADGRQRAWGLCAMSVPAVMTLRGAAAGGWVLGWAARGGLLTLLCKRHAGTTERCMRLALAAGGVREACWRTRFMAAGRGFCACWQRRRTADSGQSDRVSRQTTMALVSCRRSRFCWRRFPNRKGAQQAARACGALFALLLAGLYAVIVLRVAQKCGGPVDGALGRGKADGSR